jgi:hypothetical protein
MSIELMLGRWRGGVSLASQQDFVIAERVAELFAETVVERRDSVLTVDELTASINRYVADRNLATNVHKIVSRILDRAGLFHVDSHSGIVQFKHRSFAEYLLGKRWVDDGMPNLSQRVYEPYWRNTYFFACGVKPDCEELLTKILSTAPLDEGHRLGRFMFAGEYLLAAHMTPYRVVERVLPDVMLTAAQLYDDIVTRRTASMLSGLSETALLWLIAFIAKRQYGYGFFGRAIDAANIEIADSPATPGVKAVALFLVGVVAMEAKHEDPFGFLTNSFRADEVPLPLALAVGWESDQEGAGRLSARVRAFNKQTRKLLRTRSLAERVSLEAYLLKLQKAPIDASAHARLGQAGSPTT